MTPQQRYARQRKAREARQKAFWQRLFLQAMPDCITVPGWKRGNEPISKLADRMRLAAEFADAAYEEARLRGRI